MQTLKVLPTVKDVASAEITIAFDISKHLIDECKFKNIYQKTSTCTF